jgi:hypothetical protein
MHETLYIRHPVDDTTYDLLIVLAAKLDAMHVYERLAGHSEAEAALAQGMLVEDARDVDVLVEALHDRLCAGPGKDERSEAPHRADAVPPTAAPSGTKGGLEWSAGRP